MEGAGIFHGDMLIADRALEAKDRDIVVAAVNGELAGDVREAAALLNPFPAEGMTATPVGRQVNSPKHDGPECVKPAVPEPSLFSGA